MPEVWTTPAFDDISTSELVTADWLSDLGNNMRFLREVAYTAFVADVNVTATTVGTANQIVSAGAITYEAVPHLLEFYCCAVNPGAGSCNILVRDSTTVIGRVGFMDAAGPTQAVACQYRFTPTAAAHTYNIAAFVNSASTTVFAAGAGGAAGTTDLAGFIRITRIPT